MSKDFVFVHPYRGHGQALFKNEFESTSSSNRKYVPLELPANPEIMLNPNFLSQAIQSLPDSLIYLTGEGKDVMNLKKTLESLGKNPQSIRTERWS
jgi:ferredoxin-NADP reductase